MKKTICIISLLFFFSCNIETGIPVDYSLLPKNEQNKVVLDFSQVFDAAQIDSLSTKLINFEASTTNEIVILTVDSITPFEDIHLYSSAIGNYWKVGKKDKDNGLVLVLLKTQRKIWLSTGDGTSKILTDSICQDIIDHTMIPYFRTGDYYSGIDKGLDALIKQWH